MKILLRKIFVPKKNSSAAGGEATSRRGVFFGCGKLIFYCGKKSICRPFKESLLTAM
jgi:hypothetical protein